ncbi:hypothetical protein FRACYDRAFT_244085 [Fragilariopsis cylindrus CCMP1102]|uniref:GP-PDE domain-containing protein n=1 Tax=Fragilariopsis cylindrus CCMP1102 TaxID=635003 RepID=A0A1E7F3R5_9STRA|nr:hypothetical protein FRACYDRAFT_244085 [Fragilariopsis cylindrus CCMP1102]|eukprot:OEU12810.1 hypothetical protein FRACYDRAFT_244085 [Fragilariopsis cylindrus CCMP1102]
MISSSLSSSFRPFRLLRLRRLTPTPTLTLGSLLLLLLVLSSFQHQSLLLFTTPFAFNSNSNNNNGAVIRKRSTSAIVVGGVLGIDDDNNDEIDNNDSSSSSKFPDIVGHRGCLYEELENTREGFLKCNEMGCDSIELDVFKIYTNNNNSNCSSSDNNITSEIIVFHGGGTDESNPGDLFDYCGVEGSILDYNSMNDIQKLKFNSHHQEFQCPINKIEKGRIPTLRQVLLDTKEYNTKHRNCTGSRDNNNPDHMKIIIELKGPDISIVNDVLKLVDELNVTTICSYSSFDLKKLKLLRKLKPNKQQYRTCALYNNITPTGIILDDYEYQNQNILNCSMDCGVTDIHLKYDTISYNGLDAWSNWYET